MPVEGFVGEDDWTDCTSDSVPLMMMVTARNSAVAAAPSGAWPWKGRALRRIAAHARGT